MCRKPNQEMCSYGRMFSNEVVHLLWFALIKIKCAENTERKYQVFTMGSAVSFWSKWIMVGEETTKSNLQTIIVHNHWQSHIKANNRVQVAASISSLMSFLCVAQNWNIWYYAANCMLHKYMTTWRQIKQFRHLHCVCETIYWQTSLAISDARLCKVTNRDGTRAWQCWVLTKSPRSPLQIFSKLLEGGNRKAATCCHCSSAWEIW